MTTGRERVNCGQPGTAGRAHQETRPIVIKVKNLGTVAESEVHFKVSASCSDEDGDGAECRPGTISYSPACEGDAALLSGDTDLDPGEIVSVPNCNVTYTFVTDDDKWLHTLVISHCGVDGGGACAGNDGASDANPSNNVAIKKTKVVP